VVILMPSREITREYVKEATDAGVHDLMLKPLAPKTVRARIEHHLTNPVPFRKVDDRLIPVRRAPAPAAQAPRPGMI
jgi:DNA-binding response OmpR family regulator